MTGHLSHYNSQSCFIVYIIFHQLIRYHVLHLLKKSKIKMMHIHHLTKLFHNVI